jgi:hypothetical protein
MWHHNPALAMALAALVLQLPTSRAMSAPPIEAAKSAPAQVKLIDGTKLRRVTLTQKAAERLDIQTALIGEEASGRKTTLYASIFYDLAGEAWVYINPEPLTYVRHSVVVDAVKKGDAYLTDGPPAGTRVVTVGVSELYGTEKGVGH